ncbi:hypothetical protein [Streptomyces termitum]|uniref:hypothetical protein n=1 Tax=Streptomyces termitum TaxID=67368 RepID=UPI0033A6A72B
MSTPDDHPELADLGHFFSLLAALPSDQLKSSLGSFDEEVLTLAEALEGHPI